MGEDEGVPGIDLEIDADLGHEQGDCGERCKYSDDTANHRLVSYSIDMYAERIVGPEIVSASHYGHNRLCLVIGCFRSEDTTTQK